MLRLVKGMLPLHEGTLRQVKGTLPLYEGMLRQVVVCLFLYESKGFLLNCKCPLYV